MYLRKNLHVNGQFRIYANIVIDVATLTSKSFFKCRTFICVCWDYRANMVFLSLNSLATLSAILLSIYKNKQNFLMNLSSSRYLMIHDNEFIYLIQTVEIKKKEKD